VPQQGWLAELWDEHGADVPVIDAKDFLQAPEAHLRRLCDWLGIPFTDRMLSWRRGRRDSDGVWAPHWYAAVWDSTGFEPWRPREISLSDHDAASPRRAADLRRAVRAARSGLERRERRGEVPQLRRLVRDPNPRRSRQWAATYETTSMT
jgi:hypothetical protein